MIYAKVDSLEQVADFLIMLCHRNVVSHSEYIQRTLLYTQMCFLDVVRNVSLQRTIAHILSSLKQVASNRNTGNDSETDKESDERHPTAYAGVLRQASDDLSNHPLSAGARFRL